MFDALVIGGGPAGLQATLSLARVHRTVLQVDSGEYRNAPERHMHNLITHEGQEPADLREAARRDLAGYETVTSVTGAVTSIVGAVGDFTATFSDGTTLRARHVVLATGVRDELPAVEGLAELWGRQIVHCPFCHGHELSGRDVAVIGGVPGHLLHMSGFLSRIAGSCTLVTNGVELDAESLAQARKRGATVRTEGIEAVRADGDDGLVVSLVGGETMRFAGAFVASTPRQSAPFAEQLGLERSASDGIVVDAFGRTSVPGVYAAGDAAHHRDLPMAMASVANALGSGATAGGTCVADLMAAE